MFLKNVNSTITSLCKLFNVCLEDGYVPTDWKTVHVIPIHKKSDPQLPSNYRSISLTSVLLKKIVHEHTLSSLISNKIWPENQHGFIGKINCNKFN